MGLETPIILRKSGKGEWLFVGQCYIHGLMGGEEHPGLEYEERSSLQFEEALIV
jgi:hypothetical protein